MTKLKPSALAEMASILSQMTADLKESNERAEARHRYKFVVDIRIAGIPAQAGVTYFKEVRGSFNYNAPSDYDYYGYSEIDFDILDRKGYPAPWLANKVTDFADLRQTVLIRIS